MTKMRWTDNLFFLTVGTLLTWCMFLAIISSTELAFEPWGALLRAFIVVAALRLVFLNKYTLWFVGAVVLVAGLLLVLDAAVFTPRANYGAVIPRPTVLEGLLRPLVGTVRYIEGLVSLTPIYDATISWGVTIALGIFMLVFGFLSFNFMAILVTSMVIFAVALNFGLFDFPFGFYVYIFCLGAYLVKHLNRRSMGKNGGRAQASPFVLYAMPLTAICLVIALALPTPSEGYAQRVRENFITRPFTALSDAVAAATHPRFFSLAQTGFGGGDSRQLGGNVRPNYSRVMRVQAPSSAFPLYLSGAVFDEYTGNTWLNNFREEPPILDFDAFEHNLEFFEMITSGLTLWMADDFFETYYILVESEYLPLEFFDMRGINFRNFVMDYQTLRMYAFPPLSMINVPPEPVESAYFMLSIGDVFDHRWGIQPTPRDAARGWLGMREVPYAQRLSLELNVRDIMLEHDFRSFNAFTTGMLVDIVPPNPDINFTRDQNGAVLTDALMRRNDRLLVTYAELTRNVDVHVLKAASYRGVLADAHAAIVENEHFPTNELVFQIGAHRVSLEDLLYYYLIERANWIFETYTQLPEDLPLRVTGLAHDVTEYAENDFQRAFMLNEFLRTNFEYTLTPGNSPPDRDFVDYFLFEQGQGYCVHFATTFVVMARSLGLAARYVEGFFVTGSPDEEGFVDILNRQGHAWAEVYFEGFGWHLFEPTPPGGVFGQGPAITHIPADMPLIRGIDPTDWYVDRWNIIYGEWDVLPEMFVSGPAVEDELYAQDAGEPLAPLQLGDLILISALFVGGSGVIVMVLRALFAGLRDRKIRKLSNNDATVAYFDKMLKYLYYFNFQKGEHETPLEFTSRTDQRYLGFENDKFSLVDMAHLLYKARYGHSPVTDEERGTIERVLATLDMRLKSSLGGFRYFVYKYVKVAL